VVFFDSSGSIRILVMGSYGHGNEPSQSTEDGEFLDYLSSHLLQNDSASWNQLFG
jgi:hypothetical protein